MVNISRYKMALGAVIAILSTSAIGQINEQSTFPFNWWGRPVRNLSGVPFKLGDDIETVKYALHTKDNPTRESQFSLISTLHLPGKGIQVTFFEDSGTAGVIRFEPPFQEAINGIRLGDSEKTVLEVMGHPDEMHVRSQDSRDLVYLVNGTGTNISKRYRARDGMDTELIFNINETNGVQAIIIRHHAIGILG